MTWPMSQDYNEAIQHCSDAFADPDLRRCEAPTNAIGIPMPRSGNFADVYEVRGPGGRWAVKCFTREVPRLGERYVQISRALRQARLPFTVDFRYQQEGIFVAGRWRPILKMEWVEGLTLNQFVAQALDRPAALEALLQVWARMAGRLRAAAVAHGDLQHGNVLLVPGATAHSLALKLIDYDGMWVPSLADTKSGEVGHPSYQHPQRLREGTYGPAVDCFPLLLVATAIRALMAEGRALWEKYDNGDNLLFHQADLHEPNQSALFQDLLALGDPATAALTRHVLHSLAGGLESAPLLDEVMAHARRVHRTVGRRVATTPVLAAAAAVGSTAAPVASDPWDFDAAPDATSSGSLGDRQPKRRWAISRTAMYVAACVMGAVLAAAAGFTVWAVAPHHSPTSADPDASLAQKDSHSVPTADSSGDRQTRPIDAGVAGPPAPSAVPAAYPGKVHGFLYPYHHDGAVRVLCVSRDGRFGFSLGADGVLRRFNVEDGSEMALIPLDKAERPRALAVSPDGRRILTAGGDGHLHLRDLQSGTAKVLASRLGTIASLDIAADGKRGLSCGDDGVIRLWDLQKGIVARNWSSPQKQPLSAMRFSPGGWRAISSGPDHAARVWDLAREVQTFQILGIHAPDGSGRAPVTAVLFPDGRSAAVGMTDGTIDLWDLETREVWQTCPASVSPGAPVIAVAVSPDGRLLASASGPGVAGLFIWDLENPAAYPCETPPVAPECLAFAADGRRVLAGCIDGTIHCWAITGLKGTGPTTGARLSAVGNKLAPPSDAQVTVALEEIRRTFQADYVQLDDEEDFHNLAVKRLNQARRAVDQPLKCYVLYLEARDLAAQGDEPALGLRVVEEMGQAYDLDVRAAKVEVLRKAGAALRGSVAARVFLDAAVPLLKEAEADEAYASIAPLFPTIKQVCASAEEPEAARASALVRKMTDLQKAFEDLQTSLGTLKTAPDDPDANQAVGEFYCLRKQEWDKGVPSLALGRDKVLAAAAAGDAASPTTPEKQAAVGEAWWDRAESTEGAAPSPEFREALRRRAYAWYNRALPLLREKEAKRLVDRVADLCRRYPDLPSAWEQLDVSNATPIGDFFVRLKPGQAISTKEAVAGPVEITVVARGASGDSFFQCRQGKEVLVVWQTRAREMVVHVRRPLPTQPLAFTDDAVPFPQAQDSWNTFTCSITRDVMVHLVNGQPVTAKNHYKNEVSQSRTFQLEPKGQQNLEVKSFSVKPLQP